MTCIKGMVMNGKGSLPQGMKIKGLELSKKRKLIRQKIIQEGNPDVIFVSESDIVLRNFCSQDSPLRVYQSIGSQEAGIIFDSVFFTECTADDPMRRLRKIYEYRASKENLSSELLTRMNAVILETKVPCKRKMLYVAWHGPHKIKHDLKFKMIKDLVYIITLYLTEINIPVIIGGDYNLDLSEENLPMFAPEFKHHFLSHSKLVMCDYQKLAHRSEKIDYITLSETVTKYKITPVDVMKYVEIEYPDLPSEFPKKGILDHDPLSVELKTRTRYNSI